MLSDLKLCGKGLHWYKPDKKYRGCKECKRIRELQRYYANVKKISERRRQWGLANREYIAEKNKQHYLANREQRLKYQKNLYKANRERERERSRKWRESNPARVQEYNRTWCRNNPAKANALNAKRRAVKNKALASWANLDLIKKIYEEARRLTKATGIKHAVDHIYPLQSKYLCGLHVETNLQILTRVENTSKGNRIWPGQLDCQKD